MFRFIKYSLSFVILCVILTIQGCKKKEEHIITKEKVTGLVQKGPFIIGTAVTMSELNSSLDQTGKVFTTQIISNNGSFEFNNVSLKSSFVEFSATGFYFDEVQGGLSQSPLYLTAISDITDKSTVNVNILTHLEKFRVEYLVKHNKTFTEAKKIAQSEILAIFGFTLDDMDDSETLDISKESEENAILLAISVILEFGNNASDLTELLANIANDMKEDGILNDEKIIADLRHAAKELSLTTSYPIRSSIETRYAELGIDASIPDFEKYINEYLLLIAEKPTIETPTVTNISLTGATLGGDVNANSLSTNVYFEYGLTNSYGNSVSVEQNPLIGPNPVTVAFDLTGLLPGKTYHFRVKAENALGITYSNDYTFTTLGLIPTVVNKLTTNLTSTSITINASVNPNLLSTLVTFEYGTSNNYGNSVSALQNPLVGSASVNVSTDINGLSPGTIYYVRVSATNSVGTSFGTEMSFITATHNVGENFQGGVVAYILQEGDPGFDKNITHGLIAAPSDQSNGAVWGCAYQQLNGADGTAIGTGNQNTIDIITGCATEGTAAKLCYDLVLSGYSDWYLPSKEELDKLYLNRAAIGGFDAGYNSAYWSSSEVPSNGRNACCLFFDYYGWNCGSLSYSKDSLHKVRAIRAF